MLKKLFESLDLRDLRRWRRQLSLWMISCDSNFSRELRLSHHSFRNVFKISWNHGVRGSPSLASLSATHEISEIQGKMLRDQGMWRIPEPHISGEELTDKEVDLIAANEG